MEKTPSKKSQDENYGKSHFDEIASKISFIFLMNLAAGILGYIIIFVANRFIGSEEYGTVIFAWSFAGVFSFLADLGFSQAHIKRLSEGQDEGTFLPVFAIIKLILISIMTASVFIALWLWESFGGGYERSQIKDIIYIILSYYVLTNVGSIFVHTYSARRDAIRNQLCPLFEVFSRSMAVLIVAVFALGVIGLATTWLVAGAAYLVVAISLFRGPSLKFPSQRTFIEISKSYMKFALPLSISIIVVGASLYLDKILIQLFLSSEDVAFFFVPQRFMIIIISMGSAISLMLLPLLSEINSKKDRKYASRTAASSLFYVSLIVFPIAFFFFAFSRPILSIFVSTDFVVAENVFRILIIAYIIGVLSKPAISLLLGIDQSKIVAKITIIYALLIIGLDLILIPSKGALPFSIGLGIDGAAISLLISYSFLIVGAIWEVRRFVEFTIPTRSILLIAFISAVSSAIAMYFYSVFGATRFYEVLGYFGIDALIFVVLIILTRVLTVNELKRLISIFLPRKFFGVLKK